MAKFDMKKTSLAMLAGLLMLAQPALAAKDTVTAAKAVQQKDDDNAARVKQAELFLKVSPPQDLVAQMMSSLATSPRVKLSEADIKSIESTFDYSTLRKAMLDALVKNFNVDELKTMTQLYGSPSGQAVIHKMPGYLADLGPVLQQQLREHVGDFLKKRQEQGASVPAPASETPAPKH